MDQGGSEISYQHIGIEGCLPSPPDLCGPIDSFSYPAADGQSHCNCLYQQERRNSLKRTVGSGLQYVGMVPQETPNNSCSAHPREDEYQSRLRVEGVPGLQQLETGQGSFQPHTENMGSFLSGLVRSQEQHSATPLLQLSARPRSPSSGCLFPEMEYGNSLCIPTICSSGPLLTEDQGGQGGDRSSDSPSMGCTDLVPCVTRDVDCETNHPDMGGIPSNRPNGSAASIGDSATTATSRVESFRTKLQEQGFSDKATQIICASWRRGTEKNYNTAWKKWIGWCNTRGTNPFSTNLKEVVDFLSAEFELGKQYATLNTYRSSLSSTLPPIEGYPVGKHPLVCRLLQGMYNTNPPQPRYQTTWNVEEVLKYLKLLPGNEDLQLKDLTQKLAVIMALTNAARASDIQALDIRFLRITEEGA